jgi:hypothetical protein
VVCAARLCFGPPPEVANPCIEALTTSSTRMLAVLMALRWRVNTENATNANSRLVGAGIKALLSIIVAAACGRGYTPYSQCHGTTLESTSSHSPLKMAQRASSHEAEQQKKQRQKQLKFPPFLHAHNPVNPANPLKELSGSLLLSSASVMKQRHDSSLWPHIESICNCRVLDTSHQIASRIFFLFWRRSRSFGDLPVYLMAGTDWIWAS